MNLVPHFPHISHNVFDSNADYTRYAWSNRVPT